MAFPRTDISPYEFWPANWLIDWRNHAHLFMCIIWPSSTPHSLISFIASFVHIDRASTFTWQDRPNYITSTQCWKKFRLSVSQGSVATKLRHGGIFNNHVTANFPQNVPVTYFENRSIFGEDTDNKVGCFLGTHCSLLKTCLTVETRCQARFWSESSRGHPDQVCDNSWVEEGYDWSRHCFK